MDFNDMCAKIPDTDARMATINVADGCFMAKKWFDEHGVKYTAADLLRWSKMVTELRDFVSLTDWDDVDD